MGLGRSTVSVPSQLAADGAIAVRCACPTWCAALSVCGCQLLLHARTTHHPCPQPPFPPGHCPPSPPRKLTQNAFDLCLGSVDGEGVLLLGSQALPTGVKPQFASVFNFFGNTYYAVQTTELRVAGKRLSVPTVRVGGGWGGGAKGPRRLVCMRG